MLFVFELFPNDCLPSNGALLTLLDALKKGFLAYCVKEAAGL